MNEYRIDLSRYIGAEKQIEHDHLNAETAQDAANAIRQTWPGWYILRISVTVNDWE